ncbi:carbohydrate ABC transporter permease [Actinopolymorpha pittospori]|uniref:Multiple sugar transport system permease protein n=1 Tax=Actinopolymorpha pittospori TaxID=648752 RepID=A0A927N4B5_9ACTN|nr:carbohydrate ABC transporter permease [Actinopolymorpha pittospori]MBE1608320.1 multiple sugar transport system permease protein [Actinopolymorpha pittospori]
MIRSIVRNVLVVLLAVLWLIPTWLVVVNAFTPTKNYTGTPRWWFDSAGFLDNVQAAFDTAGVGQGMVNTLIFAVVGGLVAVLIAAAASFAVVIMPVRRPGLWFWLIFLGTVLPLQTFLSPLFTGYARTNLYDTQYGMVLVYVALTIPFAFFVNRNFMATVPREITEAAQLDGATWFRMFVRIHLPLARSALLAAFIFQFTWIWNDLLFGITLSLSPNVRPVMATLADLSGSYSTVGPPVVLAGALVVSLPTVVLFFVFQRFFVNSLRLTS